jgi:hypothetical protein
MVLLRRHMYIYTDKGIYYRIQKFIYTCLYMNLNMYTFHIYRTVDQDFDETDINGVIKDKKRGEKASQVCMYIHIYMNICISLSLYIYIYIYMSACIYVSVYTYEYIHTHIWIF